MKELTPEQLIELNKTPVRKNPTRNPRTKTANTRDFETWFKKMPQHGGTCGNPECIDPRPRSDYPTTMVSELPNGVAVCRFCFLDGYGLDDTS